MPYNSNEPRNPAGSPNGGEWTGAQLNAIEAAARKGAGLKGKCASTKQAIEIIQMQAYGSPPAHIEEYLRENGIDYVEAYHASSIGGAKHIQENGINMSSQENRPDATYFFLDKDDVGNNANNLGLGHGNSEYAVVTIRIPVKDAANIRDDGLYNGTFSESYSAARLLKSIPASWIQNVETRK